MARSIARWGRRWARWHVRWERRTAFATLVPHTLRPKPHRRLRPPVPRPDSTLEFPEEMQPPSAPDKTPGSPGGEAVKAGVTREPAAPIVGTIEFDVAPAVATAGDGKDSARDADAANAAVVAAPEPEFAAPELMLEFPDGMQTPAAPASAADKAAPAVGTIDFDAAPAPAKPDDGKDRGPKHQ